MLNPAGFMSEKVFSSAHMLLMHKRPHDGRKPAAMTGKRNKKIYHTKPFLHFAAYLGSTFSSKIEPICVAGPPFVE